MCKKRNQIDCILQVKHFTTPSVRVIYCLIRPCSWFPLLMSTTERFLTEDKDAEEGGEQREPIRF